VVAIEIDDALVPWLRQRFALPTVEIVHADVLATDLTQWGPAVITGNLPYYITSPILDKVLRTGAVIRRAVFMIQKEVADRITAKPGSRDYGYLTVVTGVFSSSRYLFTVPAAAFHPPPKVDSAVVLLDLKTPQAEDEKFLKFASLCFRQKRKTLRNNLTAQYAGISQQPESGLRAEQLSIAELRDLYARLVRSESRGSL
jgi:16S rRNA (adenine1518-N6/adenine1519-N6)-dimethyltransferase